jgi:hypothetical protein
MGGPSPPQTAPHQPDLHKPELKKSIMSREICTGGGHLRYGESPYVAGPQRVRLA